MLPFDHFLRGLALKFSIFDNIFGKYVKIYTKAMFFTLKHSPRPPIEEKSKTVRKKVRLGHDPDFPLGFWHQTEILTHIYTRKVYTGLRAKKGCI